MEISEVRKNTKVMIAGVPYNVDEAEFMKPGKGRAIYRFKLRNLLDGATLDRTYHSGEKMEEAHISSGDGQYLYKEGQHFVFMNTETFEQLLLPEAQIEDKKGFLQDGMPVTMLMLGDKLIGVTMPMFVELKVVESEMATKTATVTPQNKTAILETGVAIEVPVFVKEGDVIKVDTRSGSYVERVTGKK